MRTRAASARADGSFWWPFLVFVAFSVLWSFASPVFSVPDENAHATKAVAQVRGQIIGYTVPDVRHLVVDLPEGYYYSEDILCYMRQPDVPAACAPEFGDPAGKPWFNTWVGTYNPLYYYLVGWPSLFLDGNAAVHAMRIASSLLGSALLAWAFLAAASGARARWMPLGIAFAAAPMCMYLIGSVNPNGLEIAAAIAVWAGVLRLLETFGDESDHPGMSRGALWAGVTAASILLMNARALGPLWLVLLVVLCCLASGWEPVKRLFTTAASYWWLGVIALGGGLSLVWTLVGGSLSGQAEATDAPLVNGTFLQGVQYVLSATPVYVQQAMGYFGWLDTPLPMWTYWLLVAAFAVVVVLAFIATRRHAVLVLSTVVVAALFAPALVQGYSVHQTGIIWQGRYGLVLYLGIVIVATWLMSREAAALDRLATRAVWVVVSLVATYGVLAFFVVLERYVIGAGPIREMLTAPQWQPPLGWLPLTLAYAGASLGLVALVGSTTRRIVRREDVVAASEVGTVTGSEDPHA